MFRKLAISTTFVFTTVSLALASTAAATIPAGAGTGYTSPTVRSTPGAFPWGDVVSAVVVAAVAAACVGYAVHVTRSRRRIAAHHS